MMKSHFDKPTLQVFKRDGVLYPVTRYDAETIEEMPNDQLFDLKPTSKRSEQHHKKYFAVLNDVVKTTDKWPTSQHLHDDLKMLCGYYRTVVNKHNNQVYYIPDSIAFTKMDQQEFSKFFDQAMGKLSEAIGYDPL